MDEKTLHALTELATRLGTTVDYLWNVLLKQAPISGVIELFTLTTLVILWIGWFRFVSKKTKTPPRTKEEPDPKADWVEDSAGLAWTSVLFFFFFVIIMVMMGFSMALTSLLNPEYWALHQLLTLGR